MKNKIKIIILSLVGTLFISVVGYFIYENIYFITTDNAQIEGHIVMISPKINGFITNVHVVEGQQVQKGDVLIEIDSREYNNALDENKATLVSLQARLTDVQSNFQRAQNLYGQGATTKQQFDNAKANYLDIKSQFDNITAKVTQAELNLEFTFIKAPFDGQIAKTSAEIGQFASVGVPLIGFVDSHERWVTANFKETDIQNIKPGQSATIEVDAYPNKVFYGHVYSLSNATGASFTLLPPDNSTGNFTKIVQRVPVRIHLNSLSPNEIELLKTGLSVYVKIKKNQNDI